MPETQNNDVLYITPEKVIINLLKADKTTSLPISRLYQFILYLRKQLIQQTELTDDKPIVYDLNFDSVERTVQYRNMVFDLIGDTIYLKGVLPHIPEDIEFLPNMAQKFVEQFAA